MSVVVATSFQPTGSVRGLQPIRDRLLAALAGVRLPDQSLKPVAVVSVASIKEELRTKGRSDALEDVRQKMKDQGCACEATNPSGSCCLGTVGSGLWTSADGGDSWRRVMKGLWSESRVFGLTVQWFAELWRLRDLSDRVWAAWQKQRCRYRNK